MLHPRCLSGSQIRHTDTWSKMFYLNDKIGLKYNIQRQRLNPIQAEEWIPPSILLYFFWQLLMETFFPIKILDFPEIYLGKRYRYWFLQ